MQLTTPLALLAGLIIPMIIILYMLKKRTQPQTVSSIILWQRLDRVQRPALRLSKLWRSLLLLLQILVALLLVLALAGPVVDLAMGSETSSVIIIDTSISMAVREEGGIRLDKAVEHVRNRIRSKGSGDRIALITMGAEARVVSGFSADSAALLASLAGVDINSPRANPDAALALAANMAAAEEGVRITLYSAGCFGSLARLPEGDFEFFALGSEEVENLLVESIVPDENRLYVTIFNNGTITAKGPVEIRNSQGTLIGRRDVELEPMSRQVLVWRNLPNSPWFVAAVASKGDQLDLDNYHYSLGATQGRNKLLLVSEGNLFLERALLLYPGVSVSRVIPKSYAPALAESYELFVFDGFLPQELPEAPILVFDPPHPNPHFHTGETTKIVQYTPLSHQYLDHVDLSEVSIGFGKTIVGGSGLLESEQGLLATATERRGQPLVVFGFAVQAGDLPLRPAFPILLRNILDDFTGGNQPSLQLTYGQKVPAGEISIFAEGSSRPLPPGHGLGMGMYTLLFGKAEELIAVNPPITIDSVAARSDLEAPGGQIQGRSGIKGASLLRPLLLTALVLMGLEWWLDNYGN